MRTIIGQSDGPVRSRSRMVFVALFLFAGIVIAQEESRAQSQTLESCECRGIMSPTQVANAFWEALASKSDDTDQVKIVSKYLQLISLDSENMPEDRLDRLAIAEGAFLTFQVQIAHDHFATLLDSNDLVSRHASNRMMQIQFRALDNIAAASAMMEQFYEKFPPSEADLSGRYQQVVNFSDMYIRTGNTGDAISLIIEELQLLPTIAPFSSWSLPSRYSAEINVSSRSGEVRNLVAAKLSQLKDLERRWTQESFPASEDPILRGDMPEWYWREQSIRPGESLRAGRHRQLQGMIQSLEQWLERP